MGCGCSTRINEVAYRKLKTPIKVKGNLKALIGVRWVWQVSSADVVRIGPEYKSS